MLVHGGQSEEDKYLNDTYLLSLTTPLKWSKCNISPTTEGPTLAFHSCCLALPNDIITNNKFNIYKFPDQPLLLNQLSKVFIS
jgi:hypothetical protein